MEEAAADAHQHYRQEDGPVILGKAGDGQGDSGDQDAEAHEPVLGGLIRQIAEQGLDKRGQKGRGEHEPGHVGIVHVVIGDEKRQDGRQGAGRQVAAHMGESEKI